MRIWPYNDDDDDNNNNDNASSVVERKSFGTLGRDNKVKYM